MHHHTKFGYKMLSGSEDVFGTKPDTQSVGQAAGMRTALNLFQGGAGGWGAV